VIGTLSNPWLTLTESDKRLIRGALSARYHELISYRSDLKGFYATDVAHRLAVRIAELGERLEEDG